MNNFRCLFNITVSIAFLCLLKATTSFAQEKTFLTNEKPPYPLFHSATIKIVRGNENYPPHEFIENGKLTGFHIEVIVSVAKRLDINVQFESLPWKRALESVKTGKADAITYITPTQERNSYAIFIEENVLSESVTGFLALKKHKDKIKYSGQLRDLETYTIGVQLGYQYGSEFDHADYLNKVDILTVTQMLEMLRANRIDLAMLTLSEFNDLKAKGKLDDVYYLQPYVKHFKNYIAFSKAKARKRLAETFSKEFSIYKKTPEYQALLEKYQIQLPLLDIQ